MFPHVLYINQCLDEGLNVEEEEEEEEMGCVEMWKPVSLMVSVELSLAVVNVLMKKALIGGMDRLVIVVYRQSIATVFLIPFAFFRERYVRT